MPVVNENIALKQLKDGDVVALPTETVYGLAGRVDSEEALKKIFSIKSRPFFDPLIVHVKNLQQAKQWAHFERVSEKLARNFWPGPLTLVLPKNEKVSDLITNGGSTVALRTPNHPNFLNLLEKLNVPLAAPSANIFGKTSPTEANHVIEEFNDQVSVVDGGLCFRGIESTLIEVKPELQEVHILRPGIIYQKELEEFLNQNSIDFKVIRVKKNHVPGHLVNHYQPSIPLVLVDAPLDRPIDNKALTELKKIDPRDWVEMSISETPALAARELYGKLRAYSKEDAPVFLRTSSHWNHDNQWDGFVDRINKACSGQLRYQSTGWSFVLKHNSSQ